jgi:hypothetical protein
LSLPLWQSAGTGRDCSGRYLPLGEVEDAVERYDVGVRLTPAQQRAVRSEVQRYAGALAETAKVESTKHQRGLRELQQQQHKLLHLAYEDRSMRSCWP